MPAQPSQHQPDTTPLGRRLLWFAALWLAGVGTVAVVAYLLRLWLAPH